MVGQLIEMLIPNRHRAQHSDDVEGFKHSHPGRRHMGHHIDLWGLRKHGDEFPVEVSIARLDEGEGLAAVAIVRDMTHRYEAERALKEREAQLEELLRSKDQLIASISHEIRTPLTGIMGYARLLHDQASHLTPGERNQFVATLVEQGNELANIVDDLLVAAKPDLGKLGVGRVPVDLRAQAAIALESLDRDTVANIELTAVSSVRCLGDPVRVRQILRNLIANALRYGGPHIRITFGSDGSGGHVFVTDDGEGGPEGHHISRTLARLMGGDLIYRRQGSDTIFQLTLRLIDT